MNDEASAMHADPARAFDGQYQLGAEIGAGTLGVVYRGVDERLDKPVAIKVWHSRLGASAPLREQYDAEARALTALDHPNLVAITDYGIAGEAPYLIMELLEGETLEARMRAGALPASLTQTFMQSVLRGLGYMHMRGVMHRNLKPDNVFLHKLDAESEQLKLLDVGLESLPANTNAGSAQSSRSAYDPPERDGGTEPDGRGDVYAAGVMMLHMLSGREPTRELVRAAADSADLLEKVLPSAQPDVRAFIARAVATDRGNRFGNADQMLRALLELATPWADDPPGAVAAAVPVMLASVIAHLAPVHADLEPDAALSATGENAAAEGDGTLGAQPAGDADDLVLGPIGLIAKLRVHKRLLLIAGGVLTLAAAGGGAALLLSTGAVPEQQHQTEEDKKKSKTASKGKSTERVKVPVEEEEEDEEEEGEAQPASEPAQPEDPRYAARLGDSDTEAKPSAGAVKPSDGLQLPAATPTEKVEPGPAANAPAPEGKPIVSDKPEPAAAPPEHATGAAPSAGALPAAAASGKANAPSAVPAPGQADVGEEKAVAAPAAAPPEAQPKGKTPKRIGSERHIEPDKDEIRQMLALAISPKPRVASKNPWDIEVPSLLQALRDAIAKGEHGSSGNLKTLRRYNSANPEDVYGHLLLAGFYANRGFSLDALDQYDMAYRIDSSSRGAPEMLKHALTMVAEGIADTDAARFIERVYGREALSAVGKLAAAGDTQPAAVKRLKQLQARLTSGKRR